MAVRDFARQSRYPRKTVEFVTTDGQFELPLPTDFVLPVRVSVGYQTYGGSDPDTVDRIRGGYLSLNGAGAWYLTADGSAIGLYPTPATGTTVVVTYVYYPTALVLSSDAPSAFPEESHMGLIHHVSAYYYDEIEDNPELAERQYEKFMAKSVELERFRITQSTGDGVFFMGIRGVSR